MTSIEVVEVLLFFEGNAWKSQSRVLGPRGPSPPTTTNDTALSPAEFQNRCSIEFREVLLSSGGLGFVRSLCGLCADFVWIFCLPHKPPAQASAQTSAQASRTNLPHKPPHKPLHTQCLAYLILQTVLVIIFHCHIIKLGGEETSPVLVASTLEMSIGSCIESIFTE